MDALMEDVFVKNALADSRFRVELRFLIECRCREIFKNEERCVKKLKMWNLLARVATDAMNAIDELSPREIAIISLTYGTTPDEVFNYTVEQAKSLPRGFAGHSKNRVVHAFSLIAIVGCLMPVVHHVLLDHGAKCVGVTRGRIDAIEDIRCGGIWTMACMSVCKFVDKIDLDATECAGFVAHLPFVDFNASNH
jgi:hypothetical protein